MHSHRETTTVKVSGMLVFEIHRSYFLAEMLLYQVDLQLVQICESFAGVSCPVLIHVAFYCSADLPAQIPHINERPIQGRPRCKSVASARKFPETPRNSAWFEPVVVSRDSEGGPSSIGRAFRVLRVYICASATLRLFLPRNERRL